MQRIVSQWARGQWNDWVDSITSDSAPDNWPLPKSSVVRFARPSDQLGARRWRLMQWLIGNEQGQLCVAETRICHWILAMCRTYTVGCSHAVHGECAWCLLGWLPLTPPLYKSALCLSCDFHWKSLKTISFGRLSAAALKVTALSPTDTSLSPCQPFAHFYVSSLKLAVANSSFTQLQIPKPCRSRKFLLVRSLIAVAIQLLRSMSPLS